MKITLQDVAFMKSLIMQSYRRKMVTIIVAYLFYVIPMLCTVIYTMSTGIAPNIAIALGGIAIFLLGVITFLFKYVSSSCTKYFPWVEKSIRLKELDSCYLLEKEFSFLRRVTSFNEFFV